jgi:hypothetical protein
VQTHARLSRLHLRSASRLFSPIIYTINPRHELLWTQTLQTGESTTLTYLYRVLVDR